jgi:hypothetical protein
MIPTRTSLPDMPKMSLMFTVIGFGFYSIAAVPSLPSVQGVICIVIQAAEFCL